jgi:hypothetical protein
MCIAYRHERICCFYRILRFASIDVAVLWTVISCRLVCGCRSFDRTCCLCLQDTAVSRPFLHWSPAGPQDRYSFSWQFWGKIVIDLGGRGGCGVNCEREGRNRLGGGGVGERWGCFVTSDAARRKAFEAWDEWKWVRSRKEREKLDRMKGTIQTRRGGNVTLKRDSRRLCQRCIWQYLQEEFKSGLNPGYACYHSAQNPSSFHLLLKYVNIKIYEGYIQFCLFFCVSVKLGASNYKKNIG